MSATFTTSEYLLGTDFITNVDAFSMWAWVRWTNVTGYRTLGGQESAAAWGCKDGELYLGTSSTDHMSGDTITINTWYHVVWTVNANAHILYLNGVSALSVSDAASNNDLLIGGWGGTGGEFAGQLGPWGYFNGTVLTADQAVALYRGGRRPRGIPTPTFWNPGFDGANPQTNWVPGGTGPTKTGTTVASSEEPNVVWQRQGAIYVLGGAAPANTTLTAAQGSYTVSGQAVNTLWHHVMVAGQGSFAVSGQSITTTRNVTLVAGQGSYVLSGQDVTTLWKRVMAAAQGSYILAGQTVSTLWKHLMAAVQGSYTVTGFDITTTHSPAGAYTLVAGQGSYAVTGQDIATRRAITLTAAAGSYTVTGNSATTFRGVILEAAQGSYALAGQAAGTLWKHVLEAARGLYSLSGQAVTTTDSGAEVTDNYHQSPGTEYNPSPLAEYNNSPEVIPDGLDAYNPSPEDE